MKSNATMKSIKEAGVLRVLLLRLGMFRMGACVCVWVVRNSMYYVAIEILPFFVEVCQAAGGLRHDEHFAKREAKALVAHLGKPELLRSCRLVQPVGENGAFSSFKAKGGRAVLSGFSDLAHVLYPCRTTRS